MVGLPWKEIARLPLLNNVLPSRISLYLTLVAAVVAALWTAGRHDWTRWLIPLAVAAIVPDVGKAVLDRPPRALGVLHLADVQGLLPEEPDVTIFPFGAWDA